MTTNEQSLTGERADILEFLGKHRGFLRHTAQGLTDEQASTRSTISELTVGGLIKHVSATEQHWAEFAQGQGGSTPTEFTPEMMAAWQDQFRLVEGETLADVLAAYEKVAAATDDLVRTLDLDASYELPSAPWQPPGVFWTVRRVFLHITAETAQHAGHADIIREAIDGQKTMG
ncbi:DinB family protein [Kribbella sindirgiensis]|uniref:DinB family protein n=1 Tax=Kribbella sindirgiensis TaxID=1124744 RepID=A0A4R0JDD7_9ACTN|nr:DinB family protein [Kribbella sindirgiensis]TCC39675.1 DinB family protein [Kribbella sindirgiensis]